MANEDPAYLEWVRQQPCLVCGRSPCDPHHCGSRGMGQRSHDHTAVPLCTQHHRDYHAAGGAFRTMRRESRREWVRKAIDETWARYAGHELPPIEDCPF